MTERDRIAAMETVACAVAVLDRVKERDLDAISPQIKKLWADLLDVHGALMRSAPRDG